MLSLNEYSTSKVSTYVDDAFYERIVALREAAKGLGPSEQELRIPAESFLSYEARLIDDGRHGEWLDLFAEECLYWAPSDDEADPRRCVNIAFDDRRRLEERVVRLHTGYAHNQMPERLLQHHISNVEAWGGVSEGELRILSRQRSTGPVLIDQLAGENAQFAFRYAAPGFNIGNMVL